MAKHFAGARIFRLRTELGISQVELARRLDLSTSYLNQLENDQRPLTVPVLMKLTSTFELDAAFFAEDSQARLVSDLRASLTGTDISNSLPGEGALTEFVNRFPELAQHLVRLDRQLSEQTVRVDRLVDERNKHSGSQQFAYERVRDFFYDRRNHVPELDIEAEKLASTFVHHGSACHEELQAMLSEKYAIRVLTGTPPSPTIQYETRRHFDRQSNILYLNPAMTVGQRCFHMAVQIAFLRHGELLDDLVSADSHLDSDSRPLARIGLAQYFAGALLLPYERFLQAANQCRYDVDLLAERFGLGFETICHRLSTLQRSGRRGVPFLFVRVDRAGNISKRQSATAFHFSRGGGSCPLWVVHRAFETPHRVVRQLAIMPDGRRYLWVACTVSGVRRGFAKATPEFAVALGCAVEHADQLVYSAGLNLKGEHAFSPIGAGCRVCDRPQCAQRAFPHAGAELSVNEDSQGAEPYSHRPDK